jgi:acyl-CoA synthetase (AMP-forming)/AMP-acid ligase II
LVTPEGRSTFASLLDGATEVARGLAGIGLGNGDRVGIFMSSSIEFAEAFFACALLGVTAVPIHARYRQWELSYVFEDSGIRALITFAGRSDDTKYVSRAAEALASATHAIEHVVVFGDRPADDPHLVYLDRAALVNEGGKVSVADVDAARRRVVVRQVAAMPYTSGTTGRPKGCILTHEALVRIAQATAERWELTPSDRFWDVLPMYTLGGTYPLLSCFWGGATFITMAHFEPEEGIAMMERERCTVAYPLFPIISQALLTHPNFANADFTSIRLVVDTGPTETLQRVQHAWGAAPVVSLAGMSEVAGVFAIGSASDTLERRLSTGGTPLPGVTVRIVDPISGTDVPPGTPGEIVIHSPGRFDGYNNDPERTGETLRGDWVFSGDLGVMDHLGYVTFISRIKDMLKVGGNNVAPAEIEVFLESHPAIKIAQVVGIQNDKYLEVPVAFVELAEGHSASPDELLQFCRENLASYKVPSSFHVVDDWPVSATGKIQKAKLRDAASGAASSAASTSRPG